MPAANSVSTTNGSAQVVGYLTQFIGAEDDLFTLGGLAIPVQSVDSTTTLTLKQPWLGGTLADRTDWRILPYGPFWTSTVSLNQRLVELLKRIDVAYPLKPDAYGTFLDRAGYNNQPKGFVYLSTSPSPWVLYVKVSDANSSASWSTGQTIGGSIGDYDPAELAATTALATGTRNEVVAARGGFGSLLGALNNLLGITNNETNARVAKDGEIAVAAQKSTQAAWAALGPLAERVFPPIFDTGNPVSARGFNGTGGIGIPFVWNLQQFDTVRFAYVASSPGVAIRVAFWRADRLGTPLAAAVVFSDSRAVAWARLDRPINAALYNATIMYVTFEVIAGVSGDASPQFQGHVVQDYKDVPDPTTYPQLYVNIGSTGTTIASWIALTGGGTGAPVSFRLYDMSSTAGTTFGLHPDKLLTTPRLYGIVGEEMNVFLESLRSGQSLRMWEAYFEGYNFGKIDNRRWTWIPPGVVGGNALTIRCVDPDYPDIVRGVGTYAVTVVAANAAGGAARTILVVGDSLIESGRPTKRLLDNAARLTSSVQATLIGTNGTGTNKHEGRSGYAPANFLGVGGPFWNAGTARYDAAAYVAANGTPQIIAWHVGINTSYLCNTDAEAMLAAVVDVDRMDALIGIKTGAWTGFKQAAPSAAHLICVPTAPVHEQAGFGLVYGIARTRARYIRSLAIYSDVLIKHYSGREAAKIFLVPWNVVVDPKHGYQPTRLYANANSKFAVDQVAQSVHPQATFAAPGGYEQMGDALTAAINVLVANSLA